MIQLISLVFLGLLVNLPAQEIHFPLDDKDKKLLSAHSRGTESPFPPPMDYRSETLYVLDTNKSILFGFNLKGELRSRVGLKKPQFKSYLPFHKMVFTSATKVLLASRTGNQLAIYDLLSKKLTQVSGPASINNLYYEIAEVRRLNQYLYLLDRVTGEVRILSRLGSLMGSIPVQGEHIFPFSPTEILSVDSDGSFAAINRITMSGGNHPFLHLEPKDGEDFLSLNFVGKDKLGNLYIEQVHGSEHGLARLSLLKVSPRGKVLTSKKLPMTRFEYHEFERFFFATPAGKIFQYRFEIKKTAPVLKMVPISLDS